jgi:hypothetical protein
MTHNPFCPAVAENFGQIDPFRSQNISSYAAETLQVKTLDNHPSRFLSFLTKQDILVLVSEFLHMTKTKP